MLRTKRLAARARQSPIVLPKLHFGWVAVECGASQEKASVTDSSIGRPWRHRHRVGRLSSLLISRRLSSCLPTQDLEVALADDVIERIEADVAAIEFMNNEIRAVHIRPLTPFEYRAGQFVRLFMDARTSRNYSLASVPSLDDDLMMHVRRVPGGQVSGWIFDQMKPGDTVTISEAFGDCFYVPGRPDQNLLLLGTGCGLAPLYGIVRDALNRGHRGRIHLCHGSRDVCGLYLVEVLDRLAAGHPNFRYRPCISEGPSAEGYWAGTPLQVALDESPDLSGWRVYLCGNPQMVEAARMQTFLAGAGSSEIFADPFLPSGIAPTPAHNAQ